MTGTDPSPSEGRGHFLPLVLIRADQGFEVGGRRESHGGCGASAALGSRTTLVETAFFDFFFQSRERGKELHPKALVASGDGAEDVEADDHGGGECSGVTIRAWRGSTAEPERADDARRRSGLRANLV